MTSINIHEIKKISVQKDTWIDDNRKDIYVLTFEIVDDRNNLTTLTLFSDKLDKLKLGNVDKQAYRVRD